MKFKLLFIFILSLLIASCNQENSPEEKESSIQKTSYNEANNVEIEKYIDTKYEYQDSSSNSFYLINSLPKGGRKYLAPNGLEYTYAVFWTQIFNKGIKSIDINIQFPEDSVETKAVGGNYFRLFLPMDEMNESKVDDIDYGITNFQSELNNLYYAPKSAQKNIPANEYAMFYTVVLFRKGIEGTVRTGFKFNGSQLYYFINEMDIGCGTLDL